MSLTVGPLAAVCAAAALLLAVVGVVLWARGRTYGNPLLAGLIGLEVLLLAQVVVALVFLEQGRRPDEAGAFAGYLFVSLLLLPGGVALVADDETKYAPLVLSAACVAVAVVVGRLVATSG